jgi:glycerol-3-phosphate dehydrogenase
MSLAFQRSSLLATLKSKAVWDVVVIGGGATGLGIAVDAASRGLDTLLLEQSDFAKATSSRSTKLVHGGVRYLASGNFKLVYEALHERGLLQKNASHLVKRQAFVIPCYSFFLKMFYLVGLKLYDILSGRFSLGKSRSLSKEVVAGFFPGIKKGGLVGGVEYYDAQFDDARLAVNLAETCVEQGGVALNYFKVTGLTKNDNKVTGVVGHDMETGIEYQLTSKVVINATGVFVDDILRMDKPERKRLVRPSQGVHIVISRSFLKADRALMIPKTADGRVLFAIPWHQHLLIGTTDTPIDEYNLEPKAQKEEITFILNTLNSYLKTAVTEKDILSVFAGLRPLAAPEKDEMTTKEISRGHRLVISESGLVTITGGKWTTYRRMAEETVDQIISKGKLPAAKCKTRNLKIHGSMDDSSGSHLSVYGSDERNILQLLKEERSWSKKLVPSLPYIEAEVVWSIRNEMARTVEDVLARRLRLLFLDAHAAVEVAPRVAELMMNELQLDETWKENELIQFSETAKNYLL